MSVLTKYSLNTTCVSINFTLSVTLPLSVKMSEISNNSLQNRNYKFKSENCDYQWLSGVTDGDGCFYFARMPKKNVWAFCFKVGQSSYNLRMLYFIKSIVGVGSVSVTNSKDNIAEFRVRNIDHIIHYILPIFDNNPLLTSKHYHYSLFRKAILIFRDYSLTFEQKNAQLCELKSQVLPVGYVSPAWAIVNNTLRDKKDASMVISKSWLIGFTEAEGSFYLCNIEGKRFIHAFSINQKLDIIVIEAISLILGIYFYPNVSRNALINVTAKNHKQVCFIVDYFFKTMKGIKALEYRIWARSFLSKDHSFGELQNIQNLIRNIRSIRLDKNFQYIHKNS